MWINAEWNDLLSTFVYLNTTKLNFYDSTEKYNMTVFDKESFILPSNAPEVELIRNLIQQVKQKIPLYRQKGIYKMRNWAPAAASSFPRQGS